jgi:hypothetical protein
VPHAFALPAAPAVAYLGALLPPGVWRAPLVLAACAPAVPLAVAARRRWRWEHAGRAYELPVCYRAAALRAVAAAVLGVLLLGSAALLAYGPGPAAHAAGGASGAAALTANTPAEQGSSGGVAGAVPGPPRPRTPRAQSSPSASRSARPSPSASASVHRAHRAHRSARRHRVVAVGVPRLVGRAAGGVLYRVPGAGARVWVPPAYGYPSAARVAFPVVVAYPGGGGGALGDLFAGFAAEARGGHADPAVVVLPDARCPAVPGAARAARAERATLRAVARRFRVLPGRAARGLLGAGAAARCAVRAALGPVPRYAATAAVSGTYPGAYRPVGQPAAPATASAPAPAHLAPARLAHLALAVPGGERRARAAALGLRRRLAAAPAAPDVRLLDGGGSRRAVYAQLAAYFTEELAAPARRARAHVNASGANHP